jgi:hypothetical protein
MFSLCLVPLSRAFSTSAGGTAPMILRPYMVAAVEDTSDVGVLVDVSKERATHDVDDNMEVVASPVVKREPGTEDKGAGTKSVKRKWEEAGK